MSTLHAQSYVVSQNYYYYSHHQLQGPFKKLRMVKQTLYYNFTKYYVLTPLEAEQVRSSVQFLKNRTLTR